MSLCDFTWVDANLAIGAAFGPAHLAELRDAAIQRIVDLRSEACDDCAFLSSHGIEFLHLPTPDQAPVAPIALDMGVAWICDALERGERVLVHCQYGVGRSAMLAGCVMVARGLDLPSALRRLKQARCQISPSQVQLRAIMSWVEKRARVRGEAAELTWEELAAIVYGAGRR